jgi:hypothetical protein
VLLCTVLIGITSFWAPLLRDLLPACVKRCPCVFVSKGAWLQYVCTLPLSPMITHDHDVGGTCLPAVSAHTLVPPAQVSSISVAESGEGQVKKFVLHLTAQGVWHEPPAFVKRGLGQTGDTTGNPAVKPYDGRIHVPLALMKQHFAEVEVRPPLDDGRAASFARAHLPSPGST